MVKLLLPSTWPGTQPSNPTKPTSVAFFSLEMSSAQLVQRILSAESEIYMEKISRGRLEETLEMKQLYKKGIDQLAKGRSLSTIPLRSISSNCGPNAAVWKNKHNVGFIIIDYLQLMSGAGDNKNGNREQGRSAVYPAT